MIRSNQNNEQFLLPNEYNNLLGMPLIDFENITNSLNGSSINNTIIPKYSLYTFDNQYVPIFERKIECKKINTEKEDNNTYRYLEITESNIPQKKDLFIIKKTHRGREKKINENKNDKIHDKFTIDNRLRKVQVHYLSFIIQFLNEIIENLGLNKTINKNKNFGTKFLNINYEFKRNIKKSFVNSLKKKNIGDILRTKISKKYKNIDENYNKNLYEIYNKDKVLNKIFSEKYLKIMKIYLESNKVINLKEYGLDEKITLSSKVKMYKNLINDINVNEEYKNNIEQCIYEHLLSRPLFKTK